MNHLLHNPVFNALISGDQHLSFGTDKAKYFDENVSPFASFEEGYETGFEDLHALLPKDRVILYATPDIVPSHKGWQLLLQVKGLQFIFNSNNNSNYNFTDIVPLHKEHIEQMMQLTSLTEPGPFSSRTIDFGDYFGIFQNEKLIAMAGERLHVNRFTEVSAVCTHPDYSGRGYATNLVQHQVQLILQKGQTPFLHVREENSRAIKMYERLGFVLSRNMNFYVMKRL